MLGLLQPFRAESSRALQWLQTHLDVLQELYCLFNSTRVASQRLPGLGDVHLKTKQRKFLNYTG